MFFDAENFPVTFHVDILPGRDVLKFFGSAGIPRHIPNPPQGMVLRSEAPQSKGINANGLRGSHLIQCRGRVQEPDIMAVVLIVAVAVVRVESIGVELDVFFRITGAEPRFLDGTVRFDAASRALDVFRPVVTVVSDGADDFVFGNFLHCLGKIAGKPVL